MRPPAEQTIFFDGGVSPNPGPVLVAIVHGDTALLRRLTGVESGNNAAEFRAALAALDHAATHGLRQPTLAGDSDAVIAALGSSRPPKLGRLTSLFEECVDKDIALGGVTWLRVPRDNPAGRLIQAERRAEKAARRRARRALQGGR